MKTPRPRPITFVIVCLFAAGLTQAMALAQSVVTEARISGVTGNPAFRRNARSFALRKSDRLLPGDEIDTQAGGRVVINLSDGSQVIVAPGSIAVLKDFRQAGNLRELLDVVVGRIRVKINKLGGRPNPYRVNSPTASIAVRGTEFIVRVESSGETEVTVTEGLVEVASRLDQNQKTLVEPGRSVIVRPSGDIGLNLVGPGSELNSVGRLDFGRPDPLNEIVGSLQMQYFDALSHLNTQPVPSRFAAFADAHFDSLENPAYAAEFRRAEARLHWLPSFSRSRALVRVAKGIELDAVHPFDNTLSAQISFFAPVGKSRWVTGGAASTTRTNLEGMKAASFLLAATPDLYQERDSAAMTTRQFSVLLARSLGGSARTSFGLKFDYLQGRGLAAVEDIKRRYGFTDVLRLDMRSNIDRARLTAGLTHDFGGGKKLGLFFRAGNTPSVYSELQSFNDLRSRELIGAQIGEERHSGRTAEIGLRWRAALTRRLFYGAETLLSFEHWSANYNVRSLQSQYSSASFSVGSAARGVLGGGFGYALGKNTFLNFDLTAGRYRENGHSRNPGRGFAGLNFRNSHFVALHVGGQTDLWRSGFISGTFLRAARWESRIGISTNPSGNRTEIVSPPFVRDSNSFGLGWRLRPNVIAQYQFSSSYGSAPFSHSLLFRYTFSPPGQH